MRLCMIPPLCYFPLWIHGLTIYVWHHLMLLLTMSSLTPTLCCCRTSSRCYPHLIFLYVLFPSYMYCFFLIRSITNALANYFAGIGVAQGNGKLISTFFRRVAAKLFYNVPKTGRKYPSWKIAPLCCRWYYTAYSQGIWLIKYSYDLSLQLQWNYI
jgi:hypothetical protein